MRAAATAAICSHRPPCPGCPRFGAVDPAPQAVAALRVLARAWGVPDPMVVSHDAVGASAFASRSRARLMVRGRATSPKIGIFRSGTHRIVDIPSCAIHHPLINEVAAATRTAIRRSGARPYADGPHRGLVRAVQVVVWPEGATAQVVVVANDTTVDASRPLLVALADALGPRLQSLWWNGQPERSNTILGPHWRHVSGPSVGEIAVPGAVVCYPPDAFGQANLAMASRLIEQVHAWVPDGARVVELHAGVGAIGLGLVGRCAHVAFNEIGEGSLRGLRLGLARLDPVARARTSVHAGAAAAHLGLLREADTVIVDPPRRGLDEAVRTALAAWRGARLVYASCGVESFLTDARVIIAGGRLRPAALAVYDLFPFTDHVETLALFEGAS